MRIPLLAAGVLMALLGRPAAAQEPAPAGAEADPAQDLFVRKCASCHTVGQGRRVGPDLKGVHERRDPAWLDSFVGAPGRMLDTDPTARQLLTEANGVRMPDLGLSPAEVTGLVALIARCSAEPCQLVGRFTPVSSAVADDVERGRVLFLGTTPLQGGGAPCLSCHSAQGTGGGVPGGRLARDLTHAFGRLGDEGLDAALKNPAFPLMNKVFADHPLTADEVFALRAFLYESNRAEPAPEDQWSAPLAAGLGMLAVLGGLNAAWSRRLRGVRNTLTRHERGEDRA